MTIREQLLQQRKHSINNEHGNEYANDALQDQNTPDEKQIDEKNVTKRQYSAEEHEDRPNRMTNHNGSNSNGETPSIAQRRSLASATKRFATVK
jgi:hypothetical protein